MPVWVDIWVDSKLRIEGAVSVEYDTNFSVIMRVQFLGSVQTARMFRNNGEKSL